MAERLFILGAVAVVKRNDTAVSLDVFVIEGKDRSLIVCLTLESITAVTTRPQL